VTDAPALGGERHWATPAEAAMVEAASEVTSPWTPNLLLLLSLILAVGLLQA
jgi:hypothetical protein